MASDLLAQLQDILGGTYRVDREFGGAGMSRVFLADDIELQRQVVIKVLPPELAAGINADRFRREIQLAARLQHPHIVPLLAAGAKGGLLYYTMPFIAGENLRARLVRMRELPVSDATRIMREVADALDYAHSQGVVHRDIKPENILFSGSHALVTDFGVSKAVSNATGEMRAAGGSALTSFGLALGTPTYMAPEQAAADPKIDSRADIYALGIVGYEMLAGWPPFGGMTPQQILSAQVTATPEPIEEVRPNIPPSLAAAIMRCLEKRPADRWQTAGELCAQLETIFTPSGVTQPVAARTSGVMGALRRPTPRRVIIAAAIVGLVVAGVMLSTFAFNRGDVQFTIGSTHQMTNLPGVELYPALSPDGKLIAFVSASDSGHAQLFVRQVSGGRAVPLTDGLTDAISPRWKPDGSALIYSGAGGIAYSIPPLGGSARPLITASSVGRLTDCTWSPSGTQLACKNADDGALYVTGPNGENAVRVAVVKHDIAHSAAWSPDGKRIAYVAGNAEFLLWGNTLGNLAGSSIWVVSARGGTPVLITDETHLNTSPVWTPDGDHILFVSSMGGTRDIYAQRVKSNGKPDGVAIRITTGLNPHTISLSPDGAQLAYSVFTTSANVWSAPVNEGRPLTLADLRQVTFGNQTIESFDISRDRKWLAYDSNINGNADIYKVELPAGDPLQLTHDPADDFAPAWSPDGTEIAFHSFRNGTRDIFVMSADGTRTETVLSTPRQERNAQWSGDGSSLVYVALPDSVFVISRSAAGWGPPRFLRRGGNAVWSRNGRWIAVPESVAVELVPPDGSPGKMLPMDTGSGRLGLGAASSADSRALYTAVMRDEGTSTISRVDVATGAVAPILELRDPLRQFYRPLITADSDHVYFTLGTRESDVWVMDLLRK